MGGQTPTQEGGRRNSEATKGNETIARLRGALKEAWDL